MHSPNPLRQLVSTAASPHLPSLLSGRFCSTVRSPKVAASTPWPSPVHPAHISGDVKTGSPGVAHAQCTPSLWQQSHRQPFDIVQRSPGFGRLDWYAGETEFCHGRASPMSPLVPSTSQTLLSHLAPATDNSYVSAHLCGTQEVAFAGLGLGIPLDQSSQKATVDEAAGDNSPVIGHRTSDHSRPSFSPIVGSPGRRAPRTPLDTQRPSPQLNAPRKPRLRPAQVDTEPSPLFIGSSPLSLAREEAFFAL